MTAAGALSSRSGEMRQASDAVEQFYLHIGRCQPHRYTQQCAV
jgi:hypothetical protein